MHETKISSRIAVLQNFIASKTICYRPWLISMKAFKTSFESTVPYCYRNQSRHLLSPEHSCFVTVKRPYHTLAYPFERFLDVYSVFSAVCVVLFDVCAWLWVTRVDKKNYGVLNFWNPEPYFRTKFKAILWPTKGVLDDSAIMLVWNMEEKEISMAFKWHQISEQILSVFFPVQAKFSSLTRHQRV